MKSTFLNVAFRIILLGLTYTFLIQNEVFSQSRNFIWGINGHAVSKRSPYGNSLQLQLQQLKQIGFTYYRNDILVDKLGNVSGKERFEELLKSASRYKIKILPMIYDSWNAQRSDQENYDLGFMIGYNFTKKYFQYFSAIEIGNEKDEIVIDKSINNRFGRTADGQLPSHFNTKLINSLAASLKGMANGIHKANKNTKVIISCSNHPRWGYFEALKRNNVNFDIVGVHWYTSSGPITNIYGENGIKMFSQFKKPIWITEINRKGGSYGESGTDTEASALLSLVDEIYPYKNVQAFFIYELYDSPAEKSKGSLEGYFGIFESPKIKKEATEQLRIAIKNKSKLYKN